MKNLITSYLDDMKLAWAPSTLRSEKYRLSAVAEALEGDPAILWGLIKDKKPYTRLTIWVRVTRFWDWLLANNYKEGTNAYEHFKKKNARLFRNVYTRRSPDTSFDEANRKINQIDDIQSREKARQLLKTGMRYTESLTLQDGYVDGKGGKRRRVYASGDQPSTYSQSYSYFRRQLKAVGLKPHDLRKICFNKLVDNGINEFELCAIAGWSSINTASSYIKSDEKKLEKLMEKINE